eukprot:11830308-Ditylum_brightwellii.AAC.1
MDKILDVLDWTVDSATVVDDTYVLFVGSRLDECEQRLHNGGHNNAVNVLIFNQRVHYWGCQQVNPG